MGEAFKNDMRVKFMKLKQGSKTIDQYFEEFTRLGKYAQSMISTDADKRLKFMEGLNKEVYKLTSTHHCKNFDKLLEKARQVERSINRPSDDDDDDDDEDGDRGKKTEGKVKSASKKFKSSKSGNTSHSKKGKFKKWGKQSYSVSVASTGGSASKKIPACDTCGKHHPGVCRRANNLCFNCGSKDHYVKDCPEHRDVIPSSAPSQFSGPSGGRGHGFGRGNGGRGTSGGRSQGSSAPLNKSESKTPARTYAIRARDEAEAPDVIAGTVMLCNTTFTALIDPGSTLSYIFQKLTHVLGRPSVKTDVRVQVSNPLGHSIVLDEIFRDCPIVVHESVFLADLMRLSFEEYDLILGMDWLTRHGAIVDCKLKRVKLVNSEGSEEILYGVGYESSKCLLSALKAQKMINKGCEAYLAFVLDSRPQDIDLKNLRTVCEFSKVFPEELLGLPPEREVEFGIELQPGAAPVSIAPYRMAPVELKELKVQLEDLLDKGFIRPSISPWGAPVLFVKKKDGS